MLIKIKDNKDNKDNKDKENKSNYITEKTKTKSEIKLHIK
jgi:hypothetical protein